MTRDDYLAWERRMGFDVHGGNNAAQAALGCSGETIRKLRKGRANYDDKTLGLAMAALEAGLQPPTTEPSPDAAALAMAGEVFVSESGKAFVLQSDGGPVAGFLSGRFLLLTQGVERDSRSVPMLRTGSRFVVATADDLWAALNQLRPELIDARIAADKALLDALTENEALKAASADAKAELATLRQQVEELTAPPAADPEPAEDAAEKPRAAKGKAKSSG